MTATATRPRPRPLAANHLCGCIGTGRRHTTGQPCPRPTRTSGELRRRWETYGGKL